LRTEPGGVAHHLHPAGRRLCDGGAGYDAGADAQPRARLLVRDPAKPVGDPYSTLPARMADGFGPRGAEGILRRRVYPLHNGALARLGGPFPDVERLYRGAAVGHALSERAPPAPVDRGGAAELSAGSTAVGVDSSGRQTSTQPALCERLCGRG